MTEGVTGHQGDSARARFVAELAALRGRSVVTTDDISDWIRNRKSRTVAPSTIGDWLKPQATIPRTDEKFLLVVECLHAAASQQWTSAALERWKRLRAAAYAESRLSAQQPREAGTVAAAAEPVGVGEGDGGPASVVVGLVPKEPAHFVYRDQLRDLDEGLAHGRVAVVVTGMRGAGKTQLAAAYARQVLDHERGLVGWVNAETIDTLYTGMAEIADHLGVAAPDGDPVKSAHRLRDHLNNHPDRHLLVLDNATDPDQLRVVLPTRGGTRVMVTTTNQAMTRLADVTVDAGTGYTPEQAHTYLREATGILDDPDGEQELAEELGCLPLALAAAAAAITTARPPLTYQTYLQRLRVQPLPRALRRRDGADHPLRVDQAIMMSIQAAGTSTDDPELDTVVAWLLGLFAVLASTGVDRELLTHPQPALDELVDDAIERCVQHSLLSWSTDNILFTHRLTARVLREKARETNTVGTVLTAALDLLEAHLFDEDPWARRIEGARLVDHIDTLAGSGLPEHATHEIRTRLLSHRRWATLQLTAAADLARAIKLAHTNHTDHERVLGTDHPDTLTARNNLAGAYQSAGRLTEAIPLYEQTLADRERILGLDHPDTLTARNNLAGAYQSAGRLTEASDLLDQTLADCERVLGADHPNTLAARNNLAATYQLAGRLTEASDLHNRILADCERVLGADHADTLAARNNLAQAYQSAGRVTESIPLFEQTFTDYKRVLGPDHPSTLRSRSNLAQAYRSVERLGEAIPLFEQNLADYEDVLGTDHPDTLTARNHLARAYEMAGRLTEAILLFEQTLTDRERILGPDHPRTLNSRNNLAGAYESAGRLGEAIELYEHNLAESERVLGSDHPDTLQSRNNLAYTYHSADRLTEAIPLFERVLADRERVLGPDHPDTLQSRNNLAGAYHSADRLTEAIPLFERALADRERVLGPDHPETLQSLNNLAGAYHSAGRLTEAIPLLKRTLTVRERILGPDHPDTLTARNNLAQVSQSTGRLSEAIPLFEQLLARRERELGSNHPLTRALRDYLAVMRVWRWK
ncbi:FxSxx-COOH system tetratricopeptide repeat protein [Nocardia sp. NPDC019255]|uniref:FxSxx-COOH system tetratricopeptide repeat protein n=1 Tax=Nocardia sp. NPDC019255 TaxID=3154591 RepID=UPI0033D2927B